MSNRTAARHPAAKTSARRDSGRPALRHCPHPLTPCAAAAICALLSFWPVQAQQIAPDGRTATSLVIRGNVTDVFTATQRGSNAFNSFRTFDVNAGTIANLHVPANAQNLINLVGGSATQIHGTLNALQDGRIGGNVWFANPYGFIVGASGIVNVGSLMVSTPTPAFVDRFFPAAGQPDDAAVAQLLGGTAPRHADGRISIRGRVNASGRVDLSAGFVDVGGAIYSGARFLDQAPAVADVVNTEGLASATRVVERDGRVEIVADNDVAISGSTVTVSANAYFGGAAHAIRADDRITVDSGVVISTRNVSGGAAADQQRAPSVGASGDLTLEAPSIVLSAGSQLLAHADGGHAAGNVTLKAHRAATTDLMGYREAIASIQIGDANGGALIRGRNVGAPASTEVDTKWLYDNAGFVDSTVNLATTASEAIGGLLTGLIGINFVHSQAVGSASVVVKGGSTLTASESVTLRAENTTRAGVTPSTGLNGPGTQVDTPLGLGALYARNRSDARVEVESGATIQAQDLRLRAHNQATLEASIASGDPGEGASAAIGIAVGYAAADIQAQALVRSGANVRVAGDVSVAATNVNKLGNTVESVVGNAGRAAAAIAISDFKTAATAELGVSVRDAAKVEVLAIDDTTQNVTSANAKVGETLDEMIKNGVEQKLKPIIDPTGAAEKFFWDKLLDKKEADDKVKPKSTPFRVGGGIAYVTSTADATARIGPAAVVHATDSLVVGARSQAADLQIVARSSSVSQSRERAAADTARTSFSAGVAIGSYTHNAVAQVGRDADLTAPRIAVSGDVVIPVRESLLTGKGFDRWDGLSTLKDWANSLTGIFDVFNGSSAATSNADNSDGSIALSGSVSLLSFTNTARAVLDTNARLNLSGAATGAWTHAFEVIAADATASPAVEQRLQSWSFAAPAHLRAAREATLLFHGGEFLPSDTGGGASGSKGLGLSYTQETLTGTSEAIVREGAAIRGVDEVPAGTDADGQRLWTRTPRAAAEAQVSAEGRDLLISIAAAGGYGSSFGLNGAASIVEIENQTRALVDDESVIQAGRFTLRAEDAPIAWSVAGGFNKSSSSGVGVGIAYNGVQGTTRAAIADNDALQGERAAARTSEATATGAVAVRDLAVEARTGGRAEAIAVTGAVSWSSPANDTSSGGFFKSMEHKYLTLQNKLGELVKLEPQSVAKTGSSSPGGTSAKDKSSFGLSGAGSAAVNDVDLTTHAVVDGATVDQGVGSVPASLPASLVVRGINDTDIVTASGAAALTRANNGSQTGSAAITGSVAVNLIDTDTQGLLRGTTVTGAQGVAVQALAGGEQLSVAVGAAIDASSQQGKNNSLAITGSLSLSLVDNVVGALVEDATVTGQAAAGGRQLDVTAYNRTFIGTGGGSLALGGKTGAGGAVTYSDIGNDVTASVGGGSTVTQLDGVGVRAYNATEIGAGAAHGQASNATNGNALGGAVVITEIANRTRASIGGGSTVDAAGAVDVLAQDRGADNALEQLIDPGNGRSNVAKGLDYCGRDAAGVGATPSGNCITSVAGVVQVGRGNNIGLSFNWSDIRNDLAASVDDARLVAAGTSGIAVRAESNTTITSFALGVGASDKVSGAGSVAVNRIDNAIAAGVSGGSRLTAETIDVGAKDRSRIDTLAGQVNVGKSAAVGAAVTYAEIGNEARARVDGATLAARSATTLGAENDSRIRSLAVAGTLAVGSGAPAVSASIAVNFIANQTEATADAATFDDPAGGSSSHAVTFKADDKAEIQSLAGSVAVGSKAGVGGAFAYNGIGNTVTASLERSTLRRASVLDIAATANSKITSLSVAAAGGQTLAISGSVSLNHIGNPDGADGNVVTAEIKDSGSEGAATAASVKAADTSTIESLAGNASISLGAAAVGGAVADNATHNTAKASVSGATLQGLGSLQVEGRNTSTIRSLSAAGAGAGNVAFAGSASSNRTANTTLAEIAGSDIAGGSADVRIDALDSATIRSLAGSAAIGISAAGVGASVAVNRIANVNEARVTGKRTAAGLDLRDLGVEADSLATIDTVAVAGGIGGAVGVAGSAAINLVDSTTDAHVSGGAVVESDRNATVVAESDDRITVGAGSVGVGISAAGIGASVVVNQIGGRTRAFIAGPDSSVSARAGAGTPAVAVASGALTSPVGLAGATDASTYSRPDLVALRATESVTGVAVNASATHHVESYVANVGAGTVGISGVANVNLIGGQTAAFIDAATINRDDAGQNAAAGAAQAVHVKASDHAYGNMFIGSVAGGVVGFGVTADVALFDRATQAYVQDSTLTSKGRTTIGAQSSQGMSTVVVGGAGGLVGLVGAGSVARFTSATDAWLAGSTATVGGLDVTARHDTQMFIVGGAVAVGAVGVGATFDVALDGSVTRARIEDSTVTTSGQVGVDAQSATVVRSWTVAGAAAGAVAAAGTAAVAIVDNTTQAWVDDSDIGSAGARAAGLAVTARDNVTVEQKAGAGAGAGVAGAGVAAGVTKVENTTSAYLNDARAFVTTDVVVDAHTERRLDTTVATAGGGLFAGIGGSVGVTLVGTALDATQGGDTNANKELNKDGSGTLSQVNTFSNGDVIGSKNLSEASDNGHGGAGLSAAEVAAINNRARLDTGGRIYGAAAPGTVAEAFDPATQLAGKTAAVIGGASVVDAQRHVLVQAAEKNRIGLFTGAIAGGLAGIGGSVSVAQATYNVEAAILGTTTTRADADANGSGRIDVIASTGGLLADRSALEAKAYQAAGGAVALGAAIAVGETTNNVKAAIGRGTQTTVAGGSGAADSDGSITVKATDTADVDTEALGLQAGLVAAGAVIDRAGKSGSVVARIGRADAPTSGTSDTFVDLAAGTLSVKAERSGAVAAKATAGAGGIVAGSGADARASDGGSVQALLGNRVDVDTSGGTVDIEATATPRTRASSIGVNAGAVAVGASIAEATSSAGVSATLGAAADVNAATLTVSASRVVPTGSHTAWADATGASGGLLGVNATTATARSGGTVSSLVGDNATLDVTGTTLITAGNGSSQLADVSGIAVGIVAAGSNVASASSDTTTEASTGSLVKVSGTSLGISATGTDTNHAQARSGSGGIVAGAAASANTSGTSRTRASTGSGDATRQIDVTNFSLDARHETRFNGEVDSVSASVAGASGAFADHAVDSTVSAQVGADGRIAARHVAVQAENVSTKDWLGGAASGDAARWNIRSGAGGVIGAPAGRSESTVTHDTSAAIGERSQVHVLLPATGEGTFRLDAANVITGRDKAKLDSGGAIALARATSRFEVRRSDATVSFGEGAKVTSDLGNITAGSRSQVDVDTRAAADTYGLAGAPEGNAYSLYRGHNQAIVGSGAALLADEGGVFIAAGQSSAGVPTEIDARSKVNLWNKTAFPISTDPDAQSNVVSDASVRLLGSGRLEAAGDIAMLADKGVVDLAASGIGKDIYRETAGAIASGFSKLFGGGNVSFDITGGSTSSGGLALLEVDGTALTGIHRTKSLTLDYKLVDENCTQAQAPCAWTLQPSASDGVSFTTIPAVSLAANIQERIAKLRERMAQYAGDPVAVAAYQSEINFLMFKLVELGFAQGVDADGKALPGGTVRVDPATGQPIINPGQWSNPSPRAAARTQIVQYQAQVSGTVTTVNTAAAVVRDTGSSANTATGTIAGGATTVATGFGTLDTVDTSVDTELLKLGNRNTSAPDYLDLNSRRQANTSRVAEINALKGANDTDRAAVAAKSGEINSLLAQIAGETIPATIDAKQAEIRTKTSEIGTLLGTIAQRNGDIDTKAAEVARNVATINSLQGTLAAAWSDGDAGDVAAVSAINAARNGSNAVAARNDIGAASGTITAQAGLFAGTTGYVSTVAENRTRIDTAISARAGAQTQIADLTAQLPTLLDTPANGPIADFVVVNDITVRLGNIRTQADVLTGTGRLQAPGDAQITITNNTPNFLRLNDLTVLSDEGGTIRFNGVLVNGNADINRLNRPVPGKTAALAEVLTRDTQGPGVDAPAIVVRSNYDPNGVAYTKLPAPAPNIELEGDITNLRGSVTVGSRAGSIYSNGSINAGTVNVKAENGDFVQSFVDNFFHVGGDPASIQDNNTKLGAGIVANGSVFISARYLNLNSLVQSGIEQWNLTLPVSATLTGPASLYGLGDAALKDALEQYKNGTGPARVSFSTAAGTVTYDAVKDRIEVPMAYADADKGTAGWAARTSGLNGLYPLVADYGNVRSYYDPVNLRYVLDGTQVRGGYIQLFGQILNTSAPAAGQQYGAGRLKVLDGYGQISVQNPTNLPLVINNLDTGADPTGTGRGVAGKIDIMDVQSIDNASRTSTVVHSVYTRDFDPATGAASIRLLRENGTLDRDGVFTITGTPVDRVVDPSATSGRTTGYRPQADLRYVWTTGTDNSTVTYWTYKGAQFFGSSDLRTAPTGTVERQDGPYVLSSFRLDDGTYLSTGAELRAVHPSGVHASGDYQSTSITRTSGNALWVKTGEWSNCNWWTLCIAQNYTMTFTQTTPTKTITTKSKQADYPIAIEFGGRDAGLVTVTSDSNVLLAGAIRNRAGDAGITSKAGIVQLGDSALISSKSLSLDAGTSVGAALGSTPPRAVKVDVAGGALTATAAAGNVRIEQTLGNLRIDTVRATGDALDNLGNVFITADGSIVAANPATSVIEGHVVDLASANGGIGSIAAPLVVNAGFTDTLTQRPYHGLKAAAPGDIGIEARRWSGNLAGDLLVNTVVSSGGDVRLVAPGRILDNNPNEQIDTRTWNELLAFWDSLALTDGKNNDDKRQQALASFENGQTQDYRGYWQVRARQANPAVYDPAFQFTLTKAERDVLTAQRLSADEIARFERNRTAEYHALHAVVGGYTAAFEPDFRVRVAKGSPEEQALLKGSTWTERELGISIAPGVLKNITNTNPVIKSANAQGRNVTLQAGVAIGETQSEIQIPTSIDPRTLTEAQRVALAAAERSDMRVTDELIAVVQRKPVNFDAPGGLSVNVPAGATGHPDAGNAWLASMGDGVLGTIQVPGEARIKVRGSIVNQGDATLPVQAGSLVLEAANGGIGYVPGDPGDATRPAVVRPLRIELPDGGALIARAADNVDIVETIGDLKVDTVFSRKHATLGAPGSIVDAQAPYIDPLTGEEFDQPSTGRVRESALNVLADSMTLVARSGSIGSATNPLDVGVNPGGLIVATAATPGGSVHLHGPFIASFNIGAITSGDVARLSADTDLRLDGPVSAPGQVGLVAGGTVELSGRARVAAGTVGAFVDAGSMRMRPGAVLGVGVGTISIVTRGDAVLTELSTLNGSASAIEITSGGRVLDGDDPSADDLDIRATTAGARLTIRAQGQIGGNPLDILVDTVDASSTNGLIHLASPGRLGVGTVRGAGEVVLTAAGGIGGNAVVSNGATAEVTATGGGVALDTVSSVSGTRVTGRDGVAIAAATSSQGGVTLASDGDLEAGRVSAGGSAALTARGDVTVDAGVAGAGFSIESTGGDVLASTLAADRISLGAAGRIRGDSLTPGSLLQLAGSDVAARVDGSAGPVTGSVTGFGGALAGHVDLWLANPWGFQFTDFLTNTGSVTVPVGPFGVDRFVVANRLRVDNPQTRVLVDQRDKSFQPADAQLYTGGEGFAMRLDGNRVVTDAFVVHSSPRHDVVGPDGRPVTSAVDEANAALVRARTPLPAPPQRAARPPEGSFVTYTGVPVATQRAPTPAECQAAPNLTGCEKK